MPMSRPLRSPLFALVLATACPGVALAQRQLSWDALEVTARLGADGVLDVTEEQVLVFSGDWNGGERTFNLRPRQRLEMVGIERIDAASGTRIALRERRGLDAVDDYAMTDARTLRWRSRRPLDPPFANTRLTYAIHYRLSGILQKDGERYVLDHDFAFPQRDGAIQRFTLRLSLDPAWRPQSEVRDVYTAGPLAPGRSFVLTIPLTFAGAGSPSANDGRRPPEVVRAAGAIVAMFILSVAWLLAREHRLGRFQRVGADSVGPDWIREHIIAHPAEVVGAAWDSDIGQAEVVALLARLSSEGKIATEARTVNKGESLRLELKVDRSTLQGYERALVDTLFFDGRTRTSTEEVQAHYKDTGFDPAKVIAGELEHRATALLPRGRSPRVGGWLSVSLFLAGVACLVKEGLTRAELGIGPIVVGVIAIIAAVLGQLPGNVFRKRIDWGYAAFGLLLLVPASAAGAAVWFLWNQVGTDAVPWSVWMIGGLTLLTLWVVWSSINAMTSRQPGEAIAFRKRLAAGRAYFANELTKDRPALRDEWYPWLAAFGLARAADRWSVRHQRDADTAWRATDRATSPSPDAPSPAPEFTGFGGGRSGGAGAGAGWAAAAAGMAAGVSAPSSSGSSSDGGSSGGGSSGGGGGGGW